MRNIKINSIWKRKIVENLTWKIQVIRVSGDRVFHKIIEYNGEPRNTLVDDPIDKRTLLDAYEEE